MGIKMKKSAALLSFLFVWFFLALSVTAQKFMISHVYAEQYSFDKFANEVYYIDLVTNEIWIKNLTDSTIKPCPFPTLPEFAHNTHKCVFGKGDSLFIYDFDDGRKFLIYDSLEYYDYSFSPNDEYLLFYLHYYSFDDDLVYPMNFSPYYFSEYEYGTGTNVIYVDNENYLCEYNYVTNITDTLYVSQMNIPISTFAFNRKNEFLYFSLGELAYPKIYSYNLLTHTDSVVFNSSLDSSDDCWSTYNWFQSMEWSPDSTRMAFFSYEVDAGGTIYTFYSNNDSLHKHTDCGGEGYEYHIKWLNNDTIAYFNADTYYIEGFVLDKTLGINEKSPNIIPNSFKVSCYPNPFNNSVTINLEGVIKEPVINIYNINGEEVKRFANIQGAGYDYKLVWNGYNNSSEQVSSGVYFIVVRDKQDPFSVKGTAKIVYLK